MRSVFKNFGYTLLGLIVGGIGVLIVYGLVWLLNNNEAMELIKKVVALALILTLANAIGRGVSNDIKKMEDKNER